MPIRLPFFFRDKREKPTTWLPGSALGTISMKTRSSGRGKALPAGYSSTGSPW